MRIILVSLVLALMSPVLGWAEEIVVIVNEKNKISNLKAGQISKIYSGRMTEWPEGGSIIVVNREANSDVRWEFYKKVLNSKPTRKFFLPGSPIPFRTLVQKSTDATVRYVANAERAVSYVYRSELTGQETGIRVLEVNGLSGP